MTDTFDFAHSVPFSQLLRFRKGDFSGATDVADLRRLLKLSQSEFADALGISVHTLHNWEQGRRRLSGSARALLRSAARHPTDFRKQVLTPSR
jgi:DNA-binding transcriptional regulator YiaG